MTNIFVGNLSYQTTDSDLATTFGAFGTVESANVVRDHDSGQSRGFGFVAMPNGSEATRAISALNGQDLNGRALNVNEARAREQRGGGNSRSTSGSTRGRRDSRW